MPSYTHAEVARLVNQAVAKANTRPERWIGAFEAEELHELAPGVYVLKTNKAERAFHVIVNQSMILSMTNVTQTPIARGLMDSNVSLAVWSLGAESRVQALAWVRETTLAAGGTELPFHEWPIEIPLTSS